MAVPVTVTMVVFLMMEIISVAFNGHMEEPEMLAGSGLGSMYCTILCIALTIGLNSALTTLVSQTFGTGNLRLCGVYLNRARVVATLVFIPLTILLVNAGRISFALGFE